MHELAKAIDGNTKQKRRENIDRLGDYIEALDENLGEDPFPLIHRFTEHAYAREIFLPKDQVVVGKIHKHAHFMIFLDGDATISSQDGAIRLDKPTVMISPAGTKRAVITHEDTRIVTIHVTDETDLKKIEEEHISESYKELESKPNFEVLP